MTVPRLRTPNIGCSFHIRIFAYLIFVWAIAGSFHCRFIFIFIRREKKNLHLRECFYTLAPSFDLARVHNFREQDWKKQQKYLSATRAWNKKTTDGMKTSTRKCHLHEKRRRWSLLRLIIWCKCYVFPFWSLFNSLVFVSLLLDSVGFSHRTKSRLRTSVLLAVLLSIRLVQMRLTVANHVAFGLFPLHRAIHVFRVDYFQIPMLNACPDDFCSVRMVYLPIHSFIDHIIFNNFVSSQIRSYSLLLSLFPSLWSELIRTSAANLSNHSHTFV